MPSFSYKAVDSSGQPITGVIEAPDRKYVVRKLLAENIKPISIVQSGEGGSSTRAEENASIDFFRSSRSRSLIRLPKSLTRQGLALNFLRKLLELLASGLPMGDAVRLLSVRLTDPDQKELAIELWKNLSEGRTLAKTMAGMPEVFNESTAFLVEAGEATGNLVPILERIVGYMEEAAELRTRILSSLAYPVTICVVAFGVVLFFLLFLLPKVENILTSLGGDMPLLARILVGGSDFALKAGPFLAVAAGVLIIAFSQWRKTPLGREKTDYWILRVPFIGKIFLYSEIFQSSSLMATLMESGINTTETLRLAERTLKNTQLKRKFAVCRQQIQEGLSLAATFKMTHFMPDIAIDILTVGENTGNLVNSLREITKMNRRDLTRSLQILTGAVSTGALVFAFVLVTAIALTIIFSVFGISTTLTV